ncbi:hypothetical protein R3P38DRAFT_3616910 [Favolaschia claudopus]|uniref:Uncharacterized protein n=1 Tax=Favolaschia claudopus TaxID=2862362 RepID=A0AAW0A2B5_9AGAR
MPRCRTVLPLGRSFIRSAILNNMNSTCRSDELNIRWFYFTGVALTALSWKFRNLTYKRVLRPLKMETTYLYYRLYTQTSPLPSLFPLSPLDPTGNLSAIDINLIAPPYTVDNIVQYILQRENKDVGIAASAQVYIDHKDANPALGGTIVDIMGASTQPAKAIRVVLPGGEAPAPIWTLTAQYTVTDVQTQRWIDSRKYLHEHTMEVVQYLTFSPGDTFTTDLVRHRLDTPGYISVWKVTKVSDGKVGYVESYEYDSRYTRTKNMGGTQKPVPW